MRDDRLGRGSRPLQIRGLAVGSSIGKFIIHHVQLPHSKDMTRSSTVCFLAVLHHSFSILPFSMLSRVSNLVRRACRPCVPNPVIAPNSAEKSRVLASYDRSEERRVGKECRSRWS